MHSFVVRIIFAFDFVFFVSVFFFYIHIKLPFTARINAYQDVSRSVESIFISSPTVRKINFTTATILSTVRSKRRALKKCFPLESRSWGATWSSIQAFQKRGMRVESVRGLKKRKSTGRGGLGKR